jgi:hypothetical protein
MRLTKYLAALALTFGLTLPCFARPPWWHHPRLPVPLPYVQPVQPPAPVSPSGDYRRVFVYPNAGGGSFADMGRGRWVETNATGRFNFVETQRTPDFIELEDPSRGAWARLYATMSYHLLPDTQTWEPLYPGNWQ